MLRLRFAPGGTLQACRANPSQSRHPRHLARIPTPRSGRAIKAVHEAGEGFKLEKAPADQLPANGLAH